MIYSDEYREELRSAAEEEFRETERERIREELQDAVGPEPETEDGAGSEEERKSCRGCPDRFPGCHSGCEDYKRFQLEVEAIRQKRHLQRIVSAPLGRALDEYSGPLYERPWGNKYR